MSARRKRAYSQEETRDTTAWMVTFSDLITLLITFFVLLLSMSSMDTKKLKEMFGSLQGALGVLEYGKNTEINANPIVSLSGFEESEVAKAAHTLQDMMAQQRRGSGFSLSGVEVFADARGLIVRLPNKILFKSGSTALSPSVLPFLDDIAGFLARTGYLVRVEGHTDNVALSSSVSNWELSMNRAIKVLRYLIDKGQLSPRGFSAVGYADQKPIAPNDSEEGRAKNRRAELIITKTKR